MNVKIIASYIISIIIIAGIFLFVDVNEVAGNVLGFGMLHFLALMLLVVITFALRAVLWRELLRPFAAVSLTDSFHINNIGFLVNNILPLRIGEIAKAVLVGRKYSIGKVRAFSTVVVNRILEGAVLVLFFIAGIILAPTVSDEIKRIMIVPALLFLLMLVLFIFPHIFLRVAGKIIRGISAGIYERTRKFIEDIVMGEKAFRQGIIPNVAIALSAVAVWAVVAGIYYLALARFGIPVGLGELLIITAFTSLVTIIPSAPGFIGTFQAGFIFLFIAMGLGAEEATAVSVVIHLAFFVTTTILGMASMHLTGMKIGEVAGIGKGGK